MTFLFTDIEGSTRLVHELGDEYADALAEHRRVLRAAFERHGGVEVDTQGDAFFVAFARAGEALAAAAESQKALDSGPIRVRIGVHTGEPVVTDEGYVGIDVHRAARIAAAGHGGQVLVSQTTRDLAGADFLRDLGEHRLKDLTAAERIYQLGDADFPPLRTLHQTNLPVLPTPLLGRERELREVLALLKMHRLVTLTGAGGSGKTRLAMQVAAELVNDFGDGVWFVPLAAITDLGLVTPTIASVVGAKDELGSFLSGKQILLLLDNAEHLLPGVAAVFAELDACVLVTSRERLNLQAEQEYPLSTLALADAVELFTWRARELKPRFEPDEHVVEIARRLEGLPLAVELAAARVKVLTTKQIRERLDGALQLLRSRSRGVPERQRTLRATIDWSYALLGADESELFARLAVYAGGWTLEAAERVSEADLDVLESLVDKSLVQREGERFSMLETIREYALERLAEAGAEVWRRRHAEYFLQLGEKAEAAPPSERNRVMGGLRHDLANVRAAFRWAKEAPRSRPILEIAKVVGWFSPPGQEWRLLLEEALALADRPAAARAQALGRAGFLTRQTADAQRAVALFEESLALCRALGDESGVASALGGLGDIAAGSGDHGRARALFEEELGLFRRLGDVRGVYETLRGLGEIEREVGDLAKAKRLLDESVRLAERADDSINVARGALAIAAVAFDEGAIGTAARLYRQALALFPGEGGKAHCLMGLSALAGRERREFRAGRLLGMAMKLEERSGYRVRGYERAREAEANHAYRDSARFQRAVDEGHSMPLEAALAYAETDAD